MWLGHSERDEKMRKGTWLMIAAFLLGNLFSDALDPEDPTVPRGAVAAQIAPADTAVILAVR